VTPAITRNQGVKLTRKITMTKIDKNIIVGSFTIAVILVLISIAIICVYDNVLIDMAKFLAICALITCVAFAIIFTIVGISAVIELTKGQYGAESFKEFFKK
jgi:hypothetical protein